MSSLGVDFLCNHWNAGVHSVAVILLLPSELNNWGDLSTEQPVTWMMEVRNSTAQTTIKHPHKPIKLHRFSN